METVESADELLETFHDSGSFINPRRKKLKLKFISPQTHGGLSLTVAILTAGV